MTAKEKEFKYWLEKRLEYHRDRPNQYETIQSIETKIILEQFNKLFK